mmetsp:Transcript_64791/g.200583  ORF Transcript_64791/g.200583 Transcript_64791/m.200583 type:complete len:91 (-) Transcript_64791:621-893(-)
MRFGMWAAASMLRRQAVAAATRPSLAYASIMLEKDTMFGATLLDLILPIQPAAWSIRPALAQAWTTLLYEMTSGVMPRASISSSHRTASV